ncbi:MAG: type VI secretion system tube protein Hcp [Limnobacter sp.]|jgi:type VI secretion system secreted protein Hcp|uniref:Hcp family type VI secretion system effector n=1 Tax=Limnobacter sp. TaxID=2003368 RepID=UPI0012002539|nr:type VI secretion system tube protein Hcp [Limnobacter sp.]MDZ4050649.1 type VI secretion system tube protein Hcp [Limnobacter sp.]RZO91893.1 MAG: type VI secretion system tube protein Hcp [Limnobacter sp.]
MPADLFLKLGNVKGESVDLKHAGEIELLSARWGMQVAVGANGGVLAPAGRAEVKALRVEKRVDRASPTLHAQTCIGQLYDTMVLTKRKSGLVPLEYLRITFKDVIVSDIDISLGAGDDGDLEVVTFVFTEYQEEYKPQNGDGTGGAAVTAGFNCIKCVKI